MKRFLTLALLILCNSTFAQSKDVDLKGFNKDLNRNIYDTLDNNPQMYEKKPIRRGPASIAEPIPVEQTNEKLDEFDRQATGNGQI